MELNDPHRFTFPSSVWRAIHVGAVPIYYGSSKSSTSKWLPNGADSAIFISDYFDARQLAAEMKRLDENDADYEAFLQHKIASQISNAHLKSSLADRKWGASDDDVIEKGSFISHFECFLCDQLHDSLRGKTVAANHDAKINDYGCPEPTPFITRQRGNETTSHREEMSPIKMWQDAYWIAKYEGKAMKELMKTESQFSQDELMDIAMQFYSLDRVPDDENRGG